MEKAIKFVFAKAVSVEALYNEQPLPIKTGKSPKIFVVSGSGVEKFENVKSFILLLRIVFCFEYRFSSVGLKLKWYGE